MNKYSKKLVDDYIRNKCLGEFDSGTLENDFEFMKQVFDVSGDPNMYMCCSDELKKNYEMVFYLVNKFKRNEYFINQLCLEYIVNNSEQYQECLELAIMTNEILERKHNLKVSDVKNYVYTVYNEIVDDVILSVEEYEKESNENLGLGFLFIYYEFENSQITLDFFSKKLIDEIFFNEQCNFEKSLHKQFKNFEDIKKYGMNRFLINYIRCYDEALSSYVACNINLLENVKREMVTIKINWDKYKDLSEVAKLKIFKEEMEKFIKKSKKESGFQPSFSVEELVDYNLNGLKFHDLLAKNNIYSNLVDQLDNSEYYKKHGILSKKILAIEDTSCLKFSEELKIKIFNDENFILEKEDDVIDKPRSKVIKMPTRK